MWLCSLTYYCRNSGMEIKIHLSLKQTIGKGTVPVSPVYSQQFYLHSMNCTALVCQTFHYKPAWDTILSSLSAGTCAYKSMREFCNCRVIQITLNSMVQSYYVCGAGLQAKIKCGVSNSHCLSLSGLLSVFRLQLQKAKVNLTFLLRKMQRNVLLLTVKVSAVPEQDTCNNVLIDYKMHHSGKLQYCIYFWLIWGFSPFKL